MELKGVTQARVAKALGDRAAASSILSGRRHISKAQAKKLGELFNVDAGVLSSSPSVSTPVELRPTSGSIRLRGATCLLLSSPARETLA